MAKYLVMWEADLSRSSTDPKEQMSGMMRLLEMVKQAMKEGRISDWGGFAGGAAGYLIMEGNAADVFKGTLQYSPYINAEAYPVLSVDETMDAVKSMMG